LKRPVVEDGLENLERSAGAFAKGIASGIEVEEVRGEGLDEVFSIFEPTEFEELPLDEIVKRLHVSVGRGNPVPLKKPGTPGSPTSLSSSSCS
jgi:hypothetical protein